jgi:hypothetical protein
MSDAKRATILVVDDNAASRLLAKSTLEDEGHEVRAVSTGAEALAQVARGGVDCVGQSPEARRLHVSAAGPDTVSFQFNTANGAFQLSNAGNTSHINYLLCGDSACATQLYAYNTPGPAVSVTANPQTYTLYGELSANQTPAATGAHTQTVTAQLNY